MLFLVAVCRLINENEKAVGITEFSVSQSTLEQIFLRLAQQAEHQHGELGMSGQSPPMPAAGQAWTQPLPALQPAPPANTSPNVQITPRDVSVHPVLPTGTSDSAAPAPAAAAPVNP